MTPSFGSLQHEVYVTQTVPEATAKPVERQRPIDTYNQNKPVARTFNPVLMKFTNPAEERARVDKDHNSSMHRMNVAKDKQLVYEQTFNIVSHKSRLKGPQTTQSEKLREATRRRCWRGSTAAGGSTRRTREAA